MRHLPLQLLQQQTSVTHELTSQLSEHKVPQLD